MTSTNIVLIDPALKTNDGLVSDNLGDSIISESVQKILTILFPSKELVRISPHQTFSIKEKKIINNSLFVFVGGSNILTSNVRLFARLSPRKTKGFYLYPGIRNLILLGAGWSQYDSKPDWATIVYYKQILNSRINHSLRDTYSLKKLAQARIKNSLFTGCPTTWEIDTGLKNQFNVKCPVLCTLTDYDRNVQADTQLLQKLFSVTSLPLYFFPQGAEDITYLTSLEVFKNNKDKFILLPHDYNEFKKFIHDIDFNYVGTRLHAGIKSLSSNRPSLIIGIDNRALEMQKDLNLPVIKRSDLNSIETWITGKKNTAIRLPLENIAAWKNQFTGEEQIDS